MKEVKIVKPILVPPHPSKCQKCATDHLPEMPHNQQSFFWKVWFKMEYGREPTWEDAMKHCSEEMKKYLVKELKKYNIIID